MNAIGLESEPNGERLLVRLADFSEDRQRRVEDFSCAFQKLKFEFSKMANLPSPAPPHTVFTVLPVIAISGAFGAVVERLHLKRGVEFSAVPGVDIEPAARNPRIRAVGLRISNRDIDQMGKLVAENDVSLGARCCKQQGRGGGPDRSPFRYRRGHGYPPQSISIGIYLSYRLRWARCHSAAPAHAARPRG